MNKKPKSEPPAVAGGLNSSSETFAEFSDSEFQPPAIASGSDIESAIQTPQSAIEMPPVDSAANIPKAVEIEQLSRSKIRPIGQLHESFIIATDNEGLLLIDQHVAHERILFDKFRRKETERKIESQNLLLPETIDLSPAQAAAFSEIEEELEEFGFRFDASFGAELWR